MTSSQRPAAVAGSGSIPLPLLADLLPPKHLTLAPRGNHSGGSILAAKVAQSLTAVDRVRPIFKLFRSN